MEGKDGYTYIQYMVYYLSILSNSFDCGHCKWPTLKTIDGSCLTEAFISLCCEKLSSDWDL